jgi:hypothetical protein
MKGNGLRMRFRAVGRTAVRIFLWNVAVIVAMAPPLFGEMGAAAQSDTLTVTIVSPTNDQVVTDNAVAVVPKFQNWVQRCDLAGTPNVPGTGHWLLEIDGSLVNMYCGPAVLRLETVKPGMHTLSVIPAQNDNEAIADAKTSVKIDYKPAAPLPVPGGLHAGRPSVQIVYPHNDVTVSGKSFPLVFDVRNFRLSCELLGKPKVANTGHWHVNVDTMKGAMMGMMTMLTMGCSNAFEVPLAGISAGKHTFYVLLVDNLHAPLTPEVFSTVNVNVEK